MFNYSRLRRLVPTSDDWRMQCRELLQMIWNHEDSEPFRLPVDYVDHPGMIDKTLWMKHFLIQLSNHQIICKSSTHQWICKQSRKNCWVEITRLRWTLPKTCGWSSRTLAATTQTHVQGWVKSPSLSAKPRLSMIRNHLVLSLLHEYKLWLNFICYEFRKMRNFCFVFWEILRQES